MPALYDRLRRLIIPFELVEGHVPPDCRLVDVGCGFGTFASFVAAKSSRRSVLGMDLSSKRISAAKERYAGMQNLDFSCADITCTEIPNADIITLIDVLHHIPVRELQASLLKSCFEALSAGGTILVKDVDTKPRWKYWWNYIHDYVMTRGEPVLYLRRDDLRDSLAKVGFSITDVMEIKNYPYAHVLYVGRKPKTEGPADI